MYASPPQRYIGTPDAYRAKPSYAKMLRKIPDGAISRAAMIRGVDPRVTAQGASSRPVCETSPITPKMARLIRSVRSGSAMRPKPYADIAKAAASDRPVSQVSTKNTASTPGRSAKPGHLDAAARLEGLDRRKLLEGQGQLVRACEQPVLAKGVHLEPDRRAVGSGDRLGLEVHRQAGPGPRRERVPQPARGLARHHDGERTVLEAVLEEDVAEARPDHHPDAVIQEGPHRHLARGAAAEVLRGHQDPGLAIRGAVQHEVGPLPAVRAEAHVVEQKRAEAALAGPPQEARRDDPVGVDVGQIHRPGHPGEAGGGAPPPPPARAPPARGRPGAAAR